MRSGVQVDQIVYGTAGIWAIEVNNTSRVRFEVLRGLESFGTDYPEAELMPLPWYGSRTTRTCLVVTGRGFPP
jgi:hypothetical protein